MAQTKSQHYWRQLRSTLTAGKWDAPHPAKAPNGAPLSWSELLRKFNKHCTGSKDVAELASQTQALSLLLAANSRDRSLDGNELSERGPLSLGEECMLPEERLEEAVAGYDSLKQLESASSDSVRVALAFYAYALRRPSECLSILSQVKDLTDAQGLVFDSATMRPIPSSLHVPWEDSNRSLSSSRTGSFVSAVSSTSIADISDGRAWAVTECIRSICLKGMSQEIESPEKPLQAFSSYLEASSLISSVANEIPTSIPTKVTGATAAPLESSSFTHYRELWRWMERLLRRAIILGARLCDVRRDDQENGALWTLFQQYHTCSTHWPLAFRPNHRSTIAVLYLRALILRARAAASGEKAGADKSHRWISTARSIIQEYRAILSVSTHFPCAGERNERVEDLVDLSVALWEADGAVGEYAGWVIDVGTVFFSIAIVFDSILQVLWWATRLTFNSYRVFRHMSRLFYASGDPELAKRTLRLYIQLVSKAREASIAEIETGRDVAFGVSADVDTDHNWVQTLVQGARMLCRLALVNDDELKATEEVKEAATVLEKAKARLDGSNKELVASVQLVEAIWNVAAAYTEREPRTREIRFAESSKLLHSSINSAPTPSTHHHLALAYARAGPSQDIQKAIEHARSAIEGDQDEIRHWHLLALLLTATGDWRAAKVVLDVGARIGEAEFAEENDGLQSNGVYVQDFALPHVEKRANGETNGHARNGRSVSSGSSAHETVRETSPVTLLDSDALNIPPSASLLQPLPDRPSTSRQELRMTQLTLTEFVEGPEGVGEKWMDVFQWCSERREVGINDRRMSIDSRRVSQDLRPPSEILSADRPVATDEHLPTIYPPSDGHMESTLTPPVPIPITITPASPGIQTPSYSQEERFSAEAGRLGEKSMSEKRLSLDDNHRDMSKGKKVREVLINGVHKGRARVTTISKKIGHNVGRHHSLQLNRSNSAPDFHAVLSHAPYQASSIHLRQHLSIYSQQDLSLLQPSPPPPPLLPAPQPSTPTVQKQSHRAAKDSRLLSNLWLMSAATFRRLGKIDNARAAIQEGEVRDEYNPAVWVQLGLYHMALNNERRAMEAFQKALFIAPGDVSAMIHLCRLYLPCSSSNNTSKTTPARSDRENIDLAVGLLSELTRGAGWDVPEAWYFLAKMYGQQGRKDRERECLSFALTLSENRPLRDIVCGGRVVSVRIFAPLLYPGSAQRLVESDVTVLIILIEVL
ncbi:hypothetical protein A0H81_06881 [Grifola frondosa]|uniref:Cargo-transport protein ypp1 n=1 Tax=Grifola frondosa TaxID=5627 RepID=A0A1C7M8H6_GRIFR|nr:hypothetical protein A0H81_06881 [Grifola frondosa]